MAASLADRSLIVVFLLLIGPLRALQLLPSLTSPTVAGLVPVYPPVFPTVLPFLKQWAECGEGQKTMTVFLIFSSEADKAEFFRLWGGPPKGWTPLVISTPFPIKANPASWKKLDGLAQIIENYGAQYEFALMMDAELALNSCDGFGIMPQMLREKYAAKVWYATAAGTALHIVQEAVRGLVDIRDPAQTSKLHAATLGYTTNTWWFDVPWVQVESAKGMFDNWARVLDATGVTHLIGERARAPDAGRWSYQQIVRELVVQHVLPTPGLEGRALWEQAPGGRTPTNVTGSMGWPSTAEMIWAGQAFEHLLYQYYMVESGGFRIEVLRDVQDPFRCGVGSLSECFWRRNEVEKREYMMTVRPLWIKANQQAYRYAPPNGTCVLQFHTDRPS